MRRVGVSILLIGSLILIALPGANAAVAPGAKCSKAGVKQIHKGKVYTCTKIGKKLVWNKGLAIRKPVKSTTSTPKYLFAYEAEPNYSCRQTGEESFSLQGPLICEKNLWVVVAAAEDTVQSRAYRAVLERWNTQPEGNLSIDFYIDPNAGSWVSKIEKGLRAGARFWGTSPVGSKPVPAFISDNAQFIEEATLKAGIIQTADDKARNQNAQGGQAGFRGGQNPYWDFLFKSANSRAFVGFYQVAPHEYTHYAQRALLGENWEGEGTPWVAEGIASFIGSALGPMSDMPHNQMDDWRSLLISYTTTPLSFFNNNTQDVYQSSQWSDVYQLGALAAQALFALFGTEGVLTFYADLKAMVSKEDAFKRNFKLDRKSLSTLLEGYLESVRIKREWSLTFLQKKHQEAVVANS